MALPKNVDKYLTGRYYNPKLAGSYTSVSKLYKVIKSEGKYDIPLKKIQKWSEGQDTLTLHKTTKQRQPNYRRIVVPGPYHLWDTDLLVLNGQRFVNSNSGYAYILITVDVFDRTCRAQPIKNKGSKGMEKAFHTIFDQAEITPAFIRSDHGNEYSNKAVQDLLKKEESDTIMQTLRAKQTMLKAW